MQDEPGNAVRAAAESTGFPDAGKAVDIARAVSAYRPSNGCISGFRGWPGSTVQGSVSRPGDCTTRRAQLARASGTTSDAAMFRFETSGRRSVRFDHQRLPAGVPQSGPAARRQDKTIRRVNAGPMSEHASAAHDTSSPRKRQVRAARNSAPHKRTTAIEHLSRGAIIAATSVLWRMSAHGAGVAQRNAEVSQYGAREGSLPSAGHVRDSVAPAAAVRDFGRRGDRAIGRW
ncbi:hypothetical protein BC834DRAFT_906167 [Gloeopeniophorella convolvens]|nr:hypothetical protein BC834DRAFT_906167 [Gloeopeniophorella convolvens]